MPQLAQIEAFPREPIHWSNPKVVWQPRRHGRHDSYFLRYTFDWIQPTDWPAYKNNRLALQFPNIFTRQALQRQPGGPRWYKRARYLTELPPGGMHMSWLTYMPSVMLKVAMNRDFDFQLGSFCDSERTQAAVRPSFLTSLSSIYITMTRGKHWEVGPRHPYP